MRMRLEDAGGVGQHTYRGRGRGEGYNINVPLLPGGGHQSYVDAMELIVLMALERYRPELIVVACGYDASVVDPLARMMAHSETYRDLMQATLDAAADLCNGRVVVMHEGGYSEAYVPFCGHALIEAMAGHRTEVVDPNLDYARKQQPNDDFQKLQRRLLEEMAQEL